MIFSPFPKMPAFWRFGLDFAKIAQLRNLLEVEKEDKQAI